MKKGLHDLELDKSLHSLTLQLTKKCNLNCMFCGQAVSRLVKKEQYELSREKIREILNDAKKLGVSNISITGGEPTLRPDLIDIIKEASSLGLRVNLLTNAYVIDKTYCNELIEAGLFMLSTSLHSPVGKIHNKICGMPGSFQKLRGALTYLKSAKKSLETKITYTIHSLNYTDSCKALLLADKLRIDTIAYSHTIFSNITIDDGLRLSKEQMCEFYFKIVPLLLIGGKKFGIKVNIDPMFPGLWNKPITYQIHELRRNPARFNKEIDYYLKEDYNCGLYKSFPCSQALNSARIQANGEVTICCDSEDANFDLGNVNNQRFFDIWNSDKYKKLRDINHYPKSEVCKVCKRKFITGLRRDHEK